MRSWAIDPKHMTSIRRIWRTTSKFRCSTEGIIDENSIVYKHFSSSKEISVMGLYSRFALREQWSPCTTSSWMKQTERIYSDPRAFNKKRHGSHLMNLTKEYNQNSFVYERSVYKITCADWLLNGLRFYNVGQTGPIRFWSRIVNNKIWCFCLKLIVEQYDKWMFNWWKQEAKQTSYEVR